MTSSATCVYCSETKPVGEFNREHVIPQAFGRYEQSPVLRHAVCTDCNTYFSRTLDLRLARASPEGLERYRTGIKQLGEFHKFDQDALLLTAGVEGDYADAPLQLASDVEAGGLRARVRPTVGFHVRGSEGSFRYYSMEDFESGVWTQDLDIEPARGVKFIECDFSAARAVLARHGITFASWRELEPPEGKGIRITQYFDYPDEYMRGIAKLAFNEMVALNGAAFARQPAFDSARRYIRRGRQPFLPCVFVHPGEIFRPPRATDDNPAERPEMHIVATTTPLDADVVLGQVTLFNRESFDVILAYSTVPGLCRGGHVFSIKTRKAYRIGHKSDALPRHPN